MPEVKATSTYTISQIPVSNTTMTDSDLLETEQSATSKKVTGTVLAAYCKTKVDPDLALKMDKSANLSDVSSRATAQANMGLAGVAISVTASVVLTNPLPSFITASMILTSQTIKLPAMNASNSIAPGELFTIYCPTSAPNAVLILNQDNTGLVTVQPGQMIRLILTSNSTANGTITTLGDVLRVNTLFGDVTLTGANVDSLYTPSNYTPADATIDGHLEGIDDALGVIQDNAAAFGEMYFQGNSSATTITTIDTPVKINATYSAGQLQGFTHSNGRLTYTDSETRDFEIECNLTATYNGSSNNTTIMIAKNGTLISKSRMGVFLGGVTPAPASDPVGCFETLNTGDYIEAWIENNTGTDDPIVQDLNCRVISGGAPAGGGVSVTGENYLSEANQIITANPVNLSGTNVTGKLPYSKIEDIATNKLLGRSTSGSGVTEQLSVGTGLSLSGGTLSATGSTDSGDFSWVYNSLYSIAMVGTPTFVFGGYDKSGDFVNADIYLTFKPSATACVIAFDAPFVGATDFPGTSVVVVTGNIFLQASTTKNDAGIGTSGNIPINIVSTNTIVIPMTVSTADVFYNAMFRIRYKFQNF